MSDDIRFRNRYRVPSARLAGWDYRWAGVYHVTVCTLLRIPWFGEVDENQVHLSWEGQIVAKEWTRIPNGFPHVTLDEWIVMPDHLHGILVFQSQNVQERTPQGPSRLLAQSLGALVGQFKSNVTKRIRKDLNRSSFDWQERFHDSIIRDLDDLERLRAYIRDNPLRWTLKQPK